jgi:hypothetical protein
MGQTVNPTLTERKMSTYDSVSVSSYWVHVPPKAPLTEGRGNTIAPRKAVRLECLAELPFIYRDEIQVM